MKVFICLFKVFGHCIVCTVKNLEIFSGQAYYFHIIAAVQLVRMQQQKLLTDCGTRTSRFVLGFKDLMCTISAF